MGPGWLRIADCRPVADTKKLSYCKREFVVARFSNDVFPHRLITPIEKDRAPPMVVLSLALKAVLNQEKHINEVILASALVSNHGMLVSFALFLGCLLALIL